MTTHIENRKKSISQRIADLIFLLNQLEKENPIFHEVHNKETYFKYRLAQYQQVKEEE